MRKRVTLTLALGAVVAMAVAGIANAYKPVIVKAGNLVLTFNGGISPKKLPKKEMAPIALNVSGNIATSDNTHPPALKEFIIETDKNGGIDAKGLKTCKGGKLEATTTSQAKKACGRVARRLRDHRRRGPLPRTGSDPDQVEAARLQRRHEGRQDDALHPRLPEQPDRLGDRHHGQGLEDPQGPLRAESVASIPKIANGAGSVTNFKLTINKKFTYKGKKKSYLTAKCTSGNLVAKGQAVFATGLKAQGSVVRPCTPKN